MTFALLLFFAAVISIRRQRAQADRAQATAIAWGFGYLVYSLILATSLVGIVHGTRSAFLQNLAFSPFPLQFAGLSPHQVRMPVYLTLSLALFVSALRCSRSRRIPVILLITITTGFLVMTLNSLVTAVGKSA